MSFLCSNVQQHNYKSNIKESLNRKEERTSNTGFTDISQVSFSLLTFFNILTSKCV